MSERYIFELLAFATSGVVTLLSIGLAVVGLVYVRRVSVIAGLCLLGAGALGAFGSIIRRLVGLVASFLGGGMGLIVVSQILTAGLSILAGLLIPVAIFMLAQTIKQQARPGS